MSALAINQASIPVCFDSSRHPSGASYWICKKIMWRKKTGKAPDILCCEYNIVSYH